MAWSAAFLDRIADPTRGAVLYYVEVEAIDGAVGTGGYSVGSLPSLASEKGATIHRVTTEGERLTPGAWTVDLGGFAFSVAPLAGDGMATLEAVEAAIPRGAVVSLYVGFAGDARGSFARVGVGQVAEIDGEFATLSDGRTAFLGYRFTVPDLPSALRSRWYKAVGAHGWAYQTTATTTLSNTEAVGSSSYEVGTIVGFNRPTTGDYPYGCFRVETSAGDPYWRLWSSAAMSTFTIQAAATASLMGTTDIGASAGDGLTEAWYLRGHPADLTMQMLTSRETGNGPWDVYPAAWGLGVSYRLVDAADVIYWRDGRVCTPSSGDYEWELAGTEAVEDWYAWWAGLLSRAGWFMCMRQGQITVRPAQNMGGTHELSGYTIRDSDIQRVKSLRARVAWADVEAYQVAVFYNDGVADGPLDASGNATIDGASEVVARGTVKTLPATARITYDLSEVLWRNQSAVAACDAARLIEAVAWVGPVVEMTLPLWAAGLCLGDIVDTDIWQIPGVAQVPAMVIGRHPLWDSGVVEVTLWFRSPEVES